MNIAEQQPTWGEPPVKPRKSRVRLDTASDCRREAARQYRRAINADGIKIEDMSRLINALALISRMIEGSSLEDRIAKLEEGAR